jgi:hypothetical protein
MIKIKKPVRGNYQVTFDYDGHIQYQAEHPEIEYHGGVDFYSDNRNIYASDNGVVDKIGYDAKGYGNYIKLKHSWGYSLSCHLLVLPKFPIGFEIVEGLVMGIMGSTGNSTGTHVHFETRDLNNVVFNPELWFEDENVVAEPIVENVITDTIISSQGKVKIVCDMARVRIVPGKTGKILCDVYNGFEFTATGNKENVDGLTWREITVWIAENDGYGTQIIEDI